MKIMLSEINLLKNLYNVGKYNMLKGKNSSLYS